jgi:surface protein
MINLFNVDIDTVKFNGNEIMFMKLDNDIIFSNITEGGIYNSYNIFYSNYEDNKTVSLTKKSCNTNYNLITDWGDGTIDNKNTHTYTDFGWYTIVTNGFIEQKSGYSCVIKVNYLRPDIVDGSCLFYNFKNINYDQFYFPETSYMTDMSYMFYNCEGLKDKTVEEMIDLNSFDTSNVTNMSHMFDGCSNICDLEINNWDTSKVTDMSYMFYNCFERAGSILDLSNWNTSEVTDMSGMFCSCENLAYLNISNFNMTKVTNTDNMFKGSLLYSSSGLRLDNCDRNTVEKIITSVGFPTPTSGSHEIYVRSDQVEGLTAPDGWTFVDATPYKVGEFANNTEITEVTTTVNNTCTDLSNMFYWCSNLTTVNTTEWDTSNVTTMANMFYRCIKLTSLNLSKFNTSKVTDMSGMFEACDLLDTLNITNWDTSKVANMRNMFHNCHSLTSLNLSHFDTSKVENMSKMFDSCDSLQTLNLSGWDMTNVTNVENMFNGCKYLRTLRLDSCSKETIMKITNSGILPSGKTPNGSTRYIYCKEENFTGASYPEGWAPKFI